MKARPHKQKQSNAPVFFSIGFLVVIGGCYFIFPGFNEFIDEGWYVLRSDDEAMIKDWVSEFGAWGPVAVVVLMVAQMFLLVVPNILLMMISILSYGPVWGGLLAWLGVFAASSTGYFVGRHLGTRAVNRFVGEKTRKKLTEFVEGYGFKAILFTRVSSFSNDGLSIIAGALNMTYPRYISATMAGIAPLIIIIALYGNTGKIEKALLWISIIAIVSLVAYIIIDKKRKKKKKTKG